MDRRSYRALISRRGACSTWSLVHGEIAEDEQMIFFGSASRLRGRVRGVRTEAFPQGRGRAEGRAEPSSIKARSSAAGRCALRRGGPTQKQFMAPLQPGVAAVKRLGSPSRSSARR